MYSKNYIINLLFVLVLIISSGRAFGQAQDQVGERTVGQGSTPVKEGKSKAHHGDNKPVSSGKSNNVGAPVKTSGVKYNHLHGRKIRKLSLIHI